MNKNILITGCSSGIGLTTALLLKHQGYQVYATARKDSDVEYLQQQGLHSIRLDLNCSKSISEATDFILTQTNNSLYGLFNNGAYGQPGAVEDLSRNAIRKQFETNVFGWIELTNNIIPIMRKQGFGRIIQNSSVLGFVALKYRGAYNASKYAIEGFTDTLRLELRGSGIHVSLIEPGPIESKFRKNAEQHFIENIDMENSIHKKNYQKWQASDNKKGITQFFTLPADAVAKQVLHAIESKNPRVRYRTTIPTHLFFWLKKVLSDRMLDRALDKII